MVIIKNWSVTSKYDNVYMPPEARTLYLQGYVYGHPKFKDGDSIRTSAIKAVDGNLVTTLSGSTYQLDEPHPNFVDWCVRYNHYIPTKEQPFLVKKI
jgi:hypothetical protein